jgi:hypothetical protein
MRNDEKTKKIWFNKKDILNHYPIGTTTYKRRIKTLKDPKYSNWVLTMKYVLTIAKNKNIY